MVAVEVHDLKQLDPKFIRQELYTRSFHDEGWMQPCVQQILRGYSLERPWYKLSYNRAHILIARGDEDQVLGWGLVRHPSRRTYCSSNGWSARCAYGGRRDDFMCYVSQKYRKQGVARNLLLVAYNNWGRLATFPHDDKSTEFYRKHRNFVVSYPTENFSSAKYAAFEAGE